MGYVRTIRSGGLRFVSNSIRFVPDLEDIQVSHFEGLSACDLNHKDSSRRKNWPNKILLFQHSHSGTNVVVLNYHHHSTRKKIDKIHFCWWWWWCCWCCCCCCHIVLNINPNTQSRKDKDVSKKMYSTNFPPSSANFAMKMIKLEFRGQCYFRRFSPIFLEKWRFKKTCSDNFFFQNNCNFESNCQFFPAKLLKKHNVEPCFMNVFSELWKAVETGRAGGSGNAGGRQERGRGPSQLVQELLGRQRILQGQLDDKNTRLLWDWKMHLEN
jgi:hypothetical protein